MIPLHPRALRLGAALLGCVAAALAFRGGDPALVRILLLDESRSVAGATDAQPPTADFEPDRILRFGGEGTDIGAAIASALARIPDDARGEITLATDGRATEGDAALALAEARRRGVEIRTLARGERGLAARVAALEGPSVVRTGDRFPISVLVTGSPGAAMEVLLEDVAAGESERRSVVVPAGGRARVVFARTAGTPGVRRYRCGAAEAAVLVEGRSALLRVGREPCGAGVAELLRRLGGGAFAEGDLEGADLSALSAVVLDDLPESALPPGAGDRLRRAVEGGLGLIVLGGPSTLGPGGFAGRPVEEALPVRCAPDRPRPLLVLAIDVSGSMEPNAAAARRAAADLVERLPRDGRLGLVRFHDGPAGEAGPFDLSDPAARAAAAAEAARVTPAGGGTRFAVAAEGARSAATRSAGAGPRRLLIVTDGRPAEEEGELRRLADALAEARFVVRVVAVGGDPDLPRLRALAGADGVVSAGPADLAAALGAQSGIGDPALFDPAVARVVAGPDAPPFGALPAELPPVAGFDRVVARKDARVWLALSSGEPLLSARTLGLGRSLVFAAAPAAGTGEWATPPAASLLEAAARWALRSPGADGCAARARLRADGTVALRLECLPGSGPEGEVRAAGTTLRRVGPSTFEGIVPRESAGPEGVVAFESGGAVVARATVAREPSLEDLDLGPEVAALAALRMPGRAPARAVSGAGPAALGSALFSLALLLAAALAEARSRPRGPSVQGGGPRTIRRG